MTDDVDADAEGPTPESDPRHLDPAGDFADFFEESDVSVSLDDDTDAEELREFVERAEAGELGPADPGLEAVVRITRAVLDDVDADTDTDDPDGDGGEE